MKKTILLVEDEAILAMSEKIALEQYGYAVHTVNTGEKAVEAVKKTTDLDLILMDINLGSGIDGTEAAELILKGHDIPIVFVSSHSEREVVEKTEKITSYGYVVKSSSITVLDASIKMAFKLYEANRNTRVINDKLVATIEALPDLLFEVGLDGYYYHIHSSHPKLLYKTISELVGKKIPDTLPFETADIIMSAIREAHEVGISIGKQYQLVLPSGELHWFELSGSRIASFPDRPHFIFLARDITERKQAEEAIRESELFLVRAENIAKYGNYRISLDTKQVIASIGASVIYGIDRYNLRFEDVQKVVLPEYRNVLDRALSDLITKDIPYDMEYKICRPDNGEVVDLRSIAQYDKENKKIFGIIQEITERRHAEELLKREQERLRNVLKGTNTGIWEWNIQTGEATFDEESTGLLGYTLAELQPHCFDKWMALKHPDDMRKSNELLQKHLRGETESYTCDSRMKHKNGNWVWITGRGKMIEWDNNGKALRMFGTHNDITDRKKTEEALLESEEKFSKTFNINPSACGLSDLTTGKYVEVNEAFYTLLGFEKDEVIGRTAMDLGILTPSTRNAILVRANSDGKILNIETELRTKNGDIKHVLLSAENIDAQKKKYRYTIVHDINERKRTEVALRESEEKYRLLTEYSSDIVFSVDDKGKYNYVNNVFAFTMNKQAGDIVGKTFWDIFPKSHADARYEIVKRIFSTGEKESFEISVPTKDKLLYFYSTSNPVKDNEGKVILVVTHGKDITERKHAEDLAKKEEIRLHNVLVGTNTGTWEWNIQTGEGSLDEQSASLLGYELIEFLPDTFKKWMDLKHPDDIKESKELLAKHVRGETDQYYCESRMWHKNGYWVWILGKGKVIERDAQDRPLRIFGTHVDISEKMMVEDKLLKSENKYRQLVNNSHDIIYTLSTDGIFTYVSPSWTFYLGHSIDQVVGQPFQAFIHPEDVNVCFAGIQKAIETGERQQVAEYRVRNLDGSWRWNASNAVPLKDYTGKVIGFEGIARDITELKLAEGALHKNEEKYRSLIESSGDAIFCIDEQGQYQFTNQIFASSFGNTPDYFIGKTFWDVYPKEYADSLQDLSKMVFETGEGQSTEIVAHFENRTYYLLAKANPIKDEVGKVILNLIFATDITDRKLAEEKVKSLLDEKELILKEVHHRIKNNMSVLMSLLSLQESQMKAPEDKNIITNAQNQLRGMELLYDRLYRSENYREMKASEYLPSLVEEIVNTFPKNKKIQILTNIDDFMISIKTLSPLGIIINELTTNIMKYAFVDRGKGEIILNARKEMKTVHMEICDNGVGMPKSVSFENSTGFGLMLIGSLAKQLEGNIWIERGVGTKVVLEFEI